MIPSLPLFIPHLDFTPALHRIFTLHLASVWTFSGSGSELYFSFFISPWLLGRIGRTSCAGVTYDTHHITDGDFDFSLSFVWYWGLVSASLHSVFTRLDWYSGLSCS